MNLSDAFNNFKKSAKRLEVLQEFSIDNGEKEQFENFCEGKEFCEYDELIEWNKLIDENTKRGKIIERIRVVKNPISLYLKFEIENGYITSKKFGQKVNFVSYKNYKKLNKNKINNEFWIIDDKLIFEMIYNEKGEFIASQQVFDKSYIEFYENLKKESIPLEEVVKQLRSGKTIIKI